MALELNQIKQILQKPSKRQVIQKAVNMQRRLRFHTETNIAVSDINQPTTIFLQWVKTLLPKDKFNIFLQLFKFPLPTPDSLLRNMAEKPASARKTGQFGK